VTLPLGRAHLRDDQVDDATEAGEAVTGGDAMAGIDEAVVESALDGSSTSSPESPHETEGDVTTILIVEDSADLRAFVHAHLARRYRVLEAAGGVTGLEMAKRFLPDLILSDVMMPGMDGQALCEALRASPETDFIPIILLTARAESHERIAGLEGGADDYIVKPFSMRELEARVDNLIASRRLLRERFAAGRIELRPTSVPQSDADEAFVARVRDAIEANLGEPGFGVAELARAVFQDRSHLYRRIQSLFGESPSDLIRRLRLERAAALLMSASGNVGEVAYAVGFASVSHFTKCFREAYDMTPAVYRNEAVHR
jgi:CheY-like chemotaxis protein